MEYRRTVSVGATPACKNETGVAKRPRQDRRRPYAASFSCRDRMVDNDDDDDSSNNNNNNNINNIWTADRIDNTTALVDELEQLRTDNFQLRLRVYNAERRVDKLSAASVPRRDRIGCSDSSDTDTSDSSTDDNARELAASKATAASAVHTIHDLLTVNRRLLALLAATVSAKAVAVTADDKKRWRRLRNRIGECGGFQIKETGDAKRRESDTSATDSETYTMARAGVSVERDVSTTKRRLASPISPQPPQPPEPPQPPSTIPPEREVVQDDAEPGSELARLRARCRRLERSLQQLVNTELWARNRQIGRLEQQRYVTQAAEAAAQKELRSVAIQHQPHSTATVQVPATKGILVKAKSPQETPPAEVVAATTTTAAAATAATAAASAITPPPVLPDYSEVNFFYSCDEDEDDDDDDDTDTNVSQEADTESDGLEPIRLTSSAAPPATSTPVQDRPRKRRHRRPQQPQNLQSDDATASQSIATSSNTESVSLTNFSGGMTTATTSPTTLSRRQRRRRRRRRRHSAPRRCSTCGRCGGEDRSSPPTGTAAAVVDAQVQCGDGVEDAAVAGDGDNQLVLLNRELEARRRENSRLYDMLLRMQRGRSTRDKDRPPSADVREGRTDAASSADSDRDGGSPEPYRQAARTIRGRIADLLPPLLSMQSANGPAAPPPPPDRQCTDGRGQTQQQQQQQLRLLARLRERIVAYERQELLGGRDRTASAGDAEVAVEHMDRAALVNVALPRAVDRLRRALVPLFTQQSSDDEPAVSMRREPSVGRQIMVDASGGGDDKSIE